MSEQNCGFGLSISKPLFADGSYCCVLPYGHEGGHILAEEEQAKRWLPEGSYYQFGFKKETVDVEL